VKKVSLPALLKGGYDMKYDLRDYDGESTPYIPYINLVLNCDDLRLTISRDSYYLDYTWSSMKNNLSSALLAYLNEYLEHSLSDSIIIANHYILRNKLHSMLQEYEYVDFDQSPQNQALDKLLKAKVYPLRNQRQKYSLLDIKDKLSKDLPVFFSPDKLNTRWLGGNFRHDFVILPPKIAHYASAPDIYQRIFETLFGEAINLDTVTDNQSTLDSLIGRNIIEKSSLAPECKIIGPRHLNKNETAFLNSINDLLQDKGVQMAIEDNLHLPIRNLKAIFFDLRKEGVQVSTGLFDSEGNPIDKDFISNIMEVKDEKKKERLLQKNTILLGLRLDHPFVQYLLNCDNKHIAYYTLTYLASELTLCQKILVPYSPMHHFVKHKLAHAMRKALIARLADKSKR
jgi:hypothetical protein